MVNGMVYKVWDEISYPFPNYNGANGVSKGTKD